VRRRRITVESVASAVRALDVNPKYNEEAEEMVIKRSRLGGFVTVLIAIFGFCLMVSEIRFWLVPIRRALLEVDSGAYHRTLHVNFDIEFYELSCAKAAIDIVDESNELIDSDHLMFRARLGPDGRELALPSKSEGQCSLFACLLQCAYALALSLSLSLCTFD
jgi:hypothetical protein